MLHIPIYTDSSNKLYRRFIYLVGVWEFMEALTFDQAVPFKHWVLIFCNCLFIPLRRALFCQLEKVATIYNINTFLMTTGSSGSREDGWVWNCAWENSSLARSGRIRENAEPSLAPVGRRPAWQVWGPSSSRELCELPRVCVCQRPRGHSGPGSKVTASVGSPRPWMQQGCIAWVSWPGVRKGLDQRQGTAKTALMKTGLFDCLSGIMHRRDRGAVLYTRQLLHDQ